MTGDDQLGMLDHVDAGKRLEALQLVREGRVFGVVWELLDRRAPALADS